MRTPRRRAAQITGALAISALVTVSARAAAPNVRGKISGQDKLVPDVYAEAAKPEAKRWSWREPSPSVAAKFRTLSADPSRDVCIAAMRADDQGPLDPLRMTVTGGRVMPTTIVVTPGTQLVFKNFDPFKHRIYVVGQKTMSPEDLEANRERKWAAPPPGRYEVRDELFPSVRTFIVVDKQVAAISYPGRDGAFGFTLPAGEYYLKAFFGGKNVGKAVQHNVRERGGPSEIKDPLNLADGPTPAAAGN